MSPVGGPPPPRRPRWPILAAVVVVLILVAGVGIAVVAGTDDERPPEQASGTTTAPSTTAPPSNQRDIQARITEIQRRVEQVRELRFDQPVGTELLPTDKLAARLMEEVDEEADHDELRGQQRALVLLGELDTGTDLVGMLREVQAESVLGYYVPDEDRLYVRSDGGLTPFAEFVLAHELGHAVTDQRWDLAKGDRLADVPGGDDAYAAWVALVEGDATLLMQQYLFSQMDPAAQAAVAQEGLAQTTPKLDRSPPIVRESLGFPYSEGLAFVQALYAEGGWAAVDRAYADPPTSSEQILHPEKYLRTRDDPTEVRVPDVSGRLGGGWKADVDLGWGELDTRIVLSGEVPVSVARRAAEGWDGGRLRTFVRGDDTALVLRTVWDSPAQAQEFCRAKADWANALLGQGRGLAEGVGRWSGEGQEATLICRGNKAIWLSAPDTATLDRLQAALGGP